MKPEVRVRETFYRQARRELFKKVRLLSERKLEANLEMAAGSMPEAYAIGVEECQNEMLNRLDGVYRKLVNKMLATPANPGADHGRKEPSV
jgi:hypothetical protein